MTAYELDVIDELHFVQSFHYLLSHTDVPETDLKETLWQLALKGWVKLLQTVDQEVLPQEANFEQTYPSLYYLATKAGLMAYHMNEE